VAVTALAMAGDRERILAMGFDGYIAKPLDPDRFVSEVETHAGHAVTPLADRAAHDAASVAGGRRSAGSAAGVRVLALDDAPINVGFLRSLLEPFGYVVTHASGVGEALVAARSSVPDLIISDVHLEGETGFDFIQQVREDATLRSVPFIFLSSTAWNAADRKRGIALGAARFLVRPIEPAVLLREIEDVLAGRGAAS
jgi:two-component system cell cycle response regulator